MDKFKGKYRIKSNRMPGWDYAGNGYYFITIVTQNRECNLGEINNGNMVLSDWGKIVENEFLKSFEIRNELFLDEYIIMPNHLHAIVILKKNKTDDNGENESIGLNIDNLDESNGSHGSHGSHESHESHGSHGLHGSHGSHVETHGRASLQSQQPQPFPQPQQSNEPFPQPYEQQTNQLYRLPKSISSFLAGYKSTVNTKIDDYIDEHNMNIPKFNRNNHFFQPNYHDRIIRDKNEYWRIKNYIKQNPNNWDNDNFK